MTNSGDVSADDEATAVQHNDLRKDAINLSGVLAPSTYVLDVNGDITIAPDVTFIRVDTYAAAAVDTLVHIHGGTTGQIIIVTSLSSSKDVILEHGPAATDDIWNPAGADIILRYPNAQYVYLRFNGTYWVTFDYSRQDYLEYINFEIKGGGDGLSVISDGEFDQTYVRRGFTIVSWTMYSDVDGTIVLDPRITQFAGYVGSLTSIPGTGTKPSIGAFFKATSTPTNWDGGDDGLNCYYPSVLRVVTIGDATNIKRCWFHLEVVWVN